MKRCPQCDFIYFDTDQVCDLDGTTLVVANELPSLHDKTPVQKSGRRIVFVTLGAVSLAVLLLAVLFVLSGFRQSAQIPARTEQVQQPLPPALTSLPAPSSMSSPSPEASPSGSPKAHSSNDSSNRAVSKSPVTTSSSKPNDSTHVVIRLSNGSRIDADQVWHTKEGVWYRRSGMVTLLKENQVKSIDNSERRK